MTKKKLSILFALIGIALAVIGIIVLPESVIIQMSDGEPSSIVNKWVGVLIPFAIVEIGTVLYYINSEKKYVIIPCVGFLAFVLTFIFSLI